MVVLAPLAPRSGRDDHPLGIHHIIGQGGQVGEPVHIAAGARKSGEQLRRLRPKENAEKGVERAEALHISQSLESGRHGEQDLGEPSDGVDAEHGTPAAPGEPDPALNHLLRKDRLRLPPARHGDDAAVRKEAEAADDPWWSTMDSSRARISWRNSGGARTVSRSRMRGPLSSSMSDCLVIKLT